MSNADDSKENVPFTKRIISKKLIFQFLRFNIVGITYTIVTYLLFSFLIYIGVRYPFALVCDYTVGILMSFFLNKIFTFKVKGKASIKMFLRMLITAGINLSLNMLLLKAAVSIFSERKIVLYIAQGIIIGFLALLTFILQKTFVFKQKV
jgi:putative flippase GtrA